MRSSASWLVERAQLLSDGSDVSAGATTCCLPIGGGASLNVCTYHNCTNQEVCPVGALRTYSIRSFEKKLFEFAKGNPQEEMTPSYVQFVQQV